MPFVNTGAGYGLVTKTLHWVIFAIMSLHTRHVPVHVLSAALYDRFESRGEADFANKILSALRQQFGGHPEKKT